MTQEAAQSASSGRSNGPLEPPLYDSARRRRLAIEEIFRIVRYRDLVGQLVRRDVLTRYKRSVLGVAWTMLHPLGMMVVLLLAFSALFGTTGSVAVYLLTGLITWQFFAQTTTAAMQQTISGGASFQRLAFPRTVFAVAAIGTGLTNLVLALFPLALVMLVTATPVRTPVILLPVAVLFLGMFSLGVALLISAVAVDFPDVSEMYQLALFGWMYLTPIIYPEEILPQAYRWWILNLNPMYHLARFFRLALYHGAWPSGQELALTAAVAIVALAVGWSVFTHRADEFVYRL
jgi:ABC-2 type transport system permease protein